jgi:hypothetical protein
MKVSRHNNALMRREVVCPACTDRGRCTRCRLSQEIKGACLYRYKRERAEDHEHAQSHRVAYQRAFCKSSVKSLVKLGRILTSERTQGRRPLAHARMTLRAAGVWHDDTAWPQIGVYRLRGYLHAWGLALH